MRGIPQVFVHEGRMATCKGGKITEFHTKIVTHQKYFPDPTRSIPAWLRIGAK